MTTEELKNAISNLEDSTKHMYDDEMIRVSKKVLVSVLDNYKELLKYKDSNPNNTDKLLSSLKHEITKLNEGLFWANKNSVHKLSYDEAINIKNVLSEAYKYIKEKTL